MFGFTQTSGYNTIAAIDKDVTVVCYDRQGWGGGASVCNEELGLVQQPIFACDHPKDLLCIPHESFQHIPRRTVSGSNLAPTLPQS